MHIDEIHECPEKILTSLYMVLDKRQIQVSTGTGPLTIPVNDFTLIASTTEEHQVLQPFRDRMRLHARLQYLTIPELCRVVAIRARNLRWPLAEDVVSEIAIRARGTPRIALNILSAAYRQARSCNAPIITKDIFAAAMHLEQIDTCGLGMLERDYLRLLKESPVRVNVLASSLGVPCKTLTTVTEPFLVRQGLISKDDQSRRCLTAKGREHLLSLCIPQE